MESTNNYIETDLGNVSLNPRGAYSNEANYEYLDYVTFQGGSYTCIVEKVTGTAPVAGKTTNTWQVTAIPGGITPEYIAMRDEVIEKAKQIETSRAAVELSQQEVEIAQADVRQMRQDTQEASESAKQSKESAAGHAQSAEVSRNAAQTAENNIEAQIQGFDDHVASKKEEATEEIATRY